MSILPPVVPGPYPACHLCADPSLVIAAPGNTVPALKELIPSGSLPPELKNFPFTCKSLQYAGDSGWIDKDTCALLALTDVVAATCGCSMAVSARDAETARALEDVSVPVNDQCVNAVPLGSLPATVTGSNVLATFDDVPFPCNGASNGGGVWYSFIGDGGSVTASTCENSDFDTVISVLTGDCGALVCVDENDDTDFCGSLSLRSLVSWETIPGTVYYILVNGFNEDEIGAFELQVTEGFFATPAPTPAPILGQCESGCFDFDTCAGDLVCYFPFDNIPRDVPGCGPLLDSDSPVEGFCVDLDDIPGGELFFVVGSESDPLQQCQGGCLFGFGFDFACDAGLECWDDFLDPVVPGCIGTAPAGSGFGYCFDLQDSGGTFAPTPAPTPAPILGQCESGCFDFDTCAGDLVCYFPFANIPRDIPGCGPLLDVDDSFCVDLDDIPEGELFFVFGRESDPLQQCQGGCGFLTCDAGLECWDDVLDPVVPGCIGTAPGGPGLGYCYDPADVVVPTAAPTRADIPLDRVGNLGQPTDVYPLSRCQGDCETFSDCQGDLICFERGVENPVDSVPGCVGTPGSDFSDFCIDTVDLEPNRLVNLGTSGEPQSVFPLQKCQGNCRFNDDCAGTLACFQRSFGQTDFIPGCFGTLAEDDTNYCYDVTDVSFWFFGIDWAVVFDYVREFLAGVL